MKRNETKNVKNCSAQATDETSASASRTKASASNARACGGKCTKPSRKSK